MRGLLLLCVAVCLGCSQTLSVRSRQQAREAMVLLAEDPNLLSLFQAFLGEDPLADRLIAGTEADGFPRLRLLALEAGKGLRVQQQRWADDGGARRIERNTHLVSYARMRLRLEAGPQSASPITATAIELPLLRHQDGLWLHDKQPVATLSQADQAQLQDAAIRSALQQLQRAWAEQEREIPLDLRRRDLLPWLEQAAQGAHATALEALLELTEGAPVDAVLAYNIAVLFDIQGRYEEALPWYAQALSLEPSEAYRLRWQACQERVAADAEAWL